MPATRERLPLFRRIEELGLPVFLHPSVRSLTWETKLPPRGESGLAWMFHTSAAALGFVQNGVLDECPSLDVVHPHLGGMLPYMGARIDLRRGLGGAPEPELPIMDYLRTRFWTDCVSVTPGALELAIAKYGRERILYATDHPFVPKGAVPQVLEEHADPEDVQAIRANRLPSLRLDV
jgi:predicted TIM-barrel fold metal-dependent hydrolase